MDSHFLKVAYVSKSHGLKGEVFVRPFNLQASWPSFSSVKIGEKVFFIECCSAHKQGFIIKLKHCNSKEEADQLKSQAVFLNKQHFISQNGGDIYLAELLGFDVFILNEGGQIGRVIKFQSDKYQDFLVLSDLNSGTSDENNNVLVPFAVDYIHKIDFEHKKLILDLPENFLSIFKKIDTLL